MRKVVWLALLTFACGGAVRGATVSAAANNPAKPKPSAQEKFDAALSAFIAHEKATDWSAESCGAVAKTFDEAAHDQGVFPVASFDAGLALQRCNDDAGALAHFKTALAGDPALHRARAQIALYEYKANGNLDEAIRTLDDVVHAARFQNVDALVDLAELQMKRAGATDFESAKANIERALAIDDTYMPAQNQLALYYYARGRKHAGKPADVQQLELAALVASQAIQKNDAYAPIYNTAGLVQNELGKTNLAVQFFQRAARTDATFFEAQMNVGEVNLSFRGFAPAEAAFRKAIALRPNDYDAHLGLALAIRGQITEEAPGARIAAVHAELDACKKIDAARPDAFYNEAILAQEFEAKDGADANKIATLDRTIATLEQFKARASNRPEYALAVRKAADRIDDAKVTRDFIHH